MMDPQAVSLSLARREKRRVALTSAVAAVGLTAAKLVVGLWTGSLGVLSEAAHSALDLAAALLTYFAVRVSDRPPDRDHHYGHGKVENLSALVETALLLATCVWIVAEALQRLFYRSVEVDPSPLAFLVLAVSIAVDASRSRALARMAHKHGSQALEADALHFSTDVWSSLVVVAGLALVLLGERLDLPELSAADAVAALAVASIVALMSLRLGRRTVDALLDRVPATLAREIEAASREVEGVVDPIRVRARYAGNQLFVDAVISVERGASFEHAHAVATAVEDRIRGLAPAADVVVHTDPHQRRHETLGERIRAVANRVNVPSHDIYIHDLDGLAQVSMHVEVDGALSLGAAHALAERLEQAIHAEMPEVAAVTIHLDPERSRVQPAESASRRTEALRAKFRALARGTPEIVDCHDIAFYRVRGRLHAVCHCTLDRQARMGQVHAASVALRDRIMAELPELERVTIHAEPAEEAKEHR
jgi:cation diffusion facilitator family transporter